MRSRIVLSMVLLGACTGTVTTGESPDARPSSGDAGVTPDALPYHEGGQLEDRLCPPGSYLSFQNFAAGFFAEYCTGCHSSMIPEDMRQMAPLGINFDTPEGISANAVRIYARAADGYATMPPAGGPSAEARVLLGEWLACGMLE
jgi:hypothetical protein